MKKIIIILSIILIAVVITGCGKTTTTPATSTTSNSNTTGQANTVTIKNFAFEPATLTVKPGTVVTWTNQDSAIHKIKSPSFNSSDLKQGETFQFQFNDPGAYGYSCAINPSMNGKIMVE